MNKVLTVIFTLTLGFGFTYVSDVEAQCGMGGCSNTSSQGCGGGGCSGGGGCGMSGMAAQTGACGNPGCNCGASCPGAGCTCGTSGLGSGKMKPQNPMMKVFLDETRDLRKQLLDKRFEYSEATRNFDISVEKLIKMEEEIRIIQMKIDRFWLR